MRVMTIYDANTAQLKTTKKPSTRAILLVAAALEVQSPLVDTLSLATRRVCLPTMAHLAFEILYVISKVDGFARRMNGNSTSFQ